MGRRKPREGILRPHVMYQHDSYSGMGLFCGKSDGLLPPIISMCSPGVKHIRYSVSVCTCEREYDSSG